MPSLDYDLAAELHTRPGSDVAVPLKIARIVHVDDCVTDGGVLVDKYRIHFTHPEFDFKADDHFYMYYSPDNGKWQESLCVIDKPGFPLALLEMGMTVVSDYCIVTGKIKIETEPKENNDALIDKFMQDSQDRRAWLAATKGCVYA